MTDGGPRWTNARGIDFDPDQYDKELPDVTSQPLDPAAIMEPVTAKRIVAGHQCVCAFDDAAWCPEHGRLA